MVLSVDPRFPMARCLTLYGDSVLGWSREYFTNKTREALSVAVLERAIRAVPPIPLCIEEAKRVILMPSSISEMANAVSRRVEILGEQAGQFAEKLASFVTFNASTPTLFYTWAESRVSSFKTLEKFLKIKSHRAGGEDSLSAFRETQKEVRTLLETLQFNYSDLVLETPQYRDEDGKWIGLSREEKEIVLQVEELQGKMQVFLQDLRAMRTAVLEKMRLALSEDAAVIRG